MRRRANEINVTPLVDVLLVLLVIFMVTTPMLVKQIVIDVPQVVSVTQSKNVVQYDTIITISVDKDQNIFYNNNKVSFDTLINNLKRESPESAIAVEASKALSYQVVYSLLIKIQEAGFYNISLTGFY